MTNIVNPFAWDGAEHATKATSRFEQEKLAIPFGRVGRAWCWDGWHWAVDRGGRRGMMIGSCSCQGVKA